MSEVGENVQRLIADIETARAQVRFLARKHENELEKFEKNRQSYSENSINLYFSFSRILTDLSKTASNFIIIFALLSLANFIYCIIFIFINSVNKINTDYIGQIMSMYTNKMPILMLFALHIWVISSSLLIWLHRRRQARIRNRLNELYYIDAYLDNLLENSPKVEGLRQPVAERPAYKVSVFSQGQDK